MMSIKSVKVTLSKVKENVEREQHKGEYMPIATITYIEKDKQKKQVFLDNTMVEKGYFKCWNVGQSFFIGTTTDSYIIYDEDGNRTGTTSVGYGRIIQMDEVYFVCLDDDNWIRLINIHGFAFRGKLLTNEEVESLLK